MLDFSDNTNAGISIVTSAANLDRSVIKLREISLTHHQQIIQHTQRCFLSVVLHLHDRLFHVLHVSDQLDQLLQLGVELRVRDGGRRFGI